MPIVRKMHDDQSVMKIGQFRSGSVFSTENFQESEQQRI